MERRTEELLKLKVYTEDIDKDLTMILQSLQWDRKHILEHSPMVSCKLDSNHRILAGKVEEHEQECLLRQNGYTRDDQLLPDPLDTTASTLVKLAKKDIMNTIDNAAILDPTFKRGVGSGDMEPQTLGRLQCAYSADERRAIHDAVVSAAPSCHDLTDLALLSGSGDEQAPKAKSRTEILAELRNMRRRRTKYRVAAKSKNYSDVLRDVIKSQMELYNEVLGEVDTKPDVNELNAIIDKQTRCETNVEVHHRGSDRDRYEDRRDRRETERDREQNRSERSDRDYRKKSRRYDEDHSRGRRSRKDCSDSFKSQMELHNEVLGEVDTKPNVSELNAIINKQTRCETNVEVHNRGGDRDRYEDRRDRRETEKDREQRRSERSDIDYRKKSRRYDEDHSRGRRSGEDCSDSFKSQMELCNEVLGDVDTKPDVNELNAIINKQTRCETNVEVHNRGGARDRYEDRRDRRETERDREQNRSERSDRDYRKINRRYDEDPRRGRRSREDFSDRRYDRRNYSDHRSRELSKEIKVEVIDDNNELKDNTSHRDKYEKRKYDDREDMHPKRYDEGHSRDRKRRQHRDRSKEKSDPDEERARNLIREIKREIESIDRSQGEDISDNKKSDEIGRYKNDSRDNHREKDGSKNYGHSNRDSHNDRSRERFDERRSKDYRAHNERKDERENREKYKKTKVDNSKESYKSEDNETRRSRTGEKHRRYYEIYSELDKLRKNKSNDDND